MIETQYSLLFVHKTKNHSFISPAVKYHYTCTNNSFLCSIGTDPQHKQQRKKMSSTSRRRSSTKRRISIPPTQKSSELFQDHSTLSMASSSTCSQSTSSSSSNTTSNRQRHVVIRFQKTPQVQEVEPVPFHRRHEVYYQAEELQRIRHRDILHNKRAQMDVRSGSIESEHQTWRGLEDIRDDCCRRENSEWHTNAVLKEIQRHKHHFGCVQEDQLRQFSKVISKPDKLRAQKMGTKDATAAGIAMTRTLATRTSQNISRSLSWLKRTPTSSTSLMAKKIITVTAY